MAEIAPLTWHNLFETVEGWVALGTLALAAGTFVLALMTRSMASKAGDEIELTRQTAQDMRRQTSATEQQAGVARDTLAATFRPTLVNVPQDYDGFKTGEIIRYINGPTIELPAVNRWLVNVEESMKHVHFSVPVRNTGQGVAFIRATGLRWQSETNEANGNPSNAIVPPGETARIAFSLAKLPENTASLIDRIVQYGSFSIEVVYADLGENLWNTRIDVNKRQFSDGWYVYQVFVKSHGVPDDEAVGSGAMFEA